MNYLFFCSELRNVGLKEKYPQLLVNIVGMQEKDFVKLPDGVNCYGVLDKAQKKDRTVWKAIAQHDKFLVYF